MAIELLDQRLEKAVGLRHFDQALQRGAILPDARQNVLLRGYALLAGIDHDQRGRRKSNRDHQENDDAKGKNRESERQDAASVVPHEGERTRGRERTAQACGGFARLAVRRMSRLPRRGNTGRSGACRVCAATERHGFYSDSTGEHCSVPAPT
jgi:hypothetical protein